MEDQNQREEKEDSGLSEEIHGAGQEKEKAAKSSGGLKTALGIFAGMAVLLFGLLVGGFAMWLYFSQKDDFSASLEDTDSAEEIKDDEEGGDSELEDGDLHADDGDDLALEEDESIVNEATDADSWIFPAGIFDDYTYVRYICDGYAGMDPDKYFMDVEYPEYVTITTDWREVGLLGECDLRFAYGTSYLILQFNVGEAYPVSLDAGSSDLLTVGGETLIKTAMTLSSGQYSYSYMTKMVDSACDGGEMLPELTAPCAAPIHPFLPGATMVAVSIPESTGASERSDIVDLFDDIAKRLHGAEN